MLLISWDAYGEWMTMVVVDWLAVCFLNLQCLLGLVVVLLRYLAISCSQATRLQHLPQPQTEMYLQHICSAGVYLLRLMMLTKNTCTAKSVDSFHCG